MTFHLSAAAAAEAGFRPCLRCFPEYSPNFVRQNNSTEIIIRAMRLIQNGVVDEHGVSGLSQQLNLSERHLRRIFAENLGASPQAFAQTRRVHLAKQLINDTSLPMTKIAFAAGFQTIRQFNGVIKKIFGRPPRDLRRLNRNASKSASLQLKLSYRPPFDWDALLWFLTRRLSSGLEQISDKIYSRFVAFGDDCGVIEVVDLPDKYCLELKVPANLWMHVPVLIDKTSRLFDLTSDPETILTHLKSDSILTNHLNVNCGVRVPGCWDPFELAVRTILGQQVSVAGATTLCSRLIERWGIRKQDGPLGTTFPCPTALVDSDIASIGLPKSRANSIRQLANAFVRGTLSFDGSIGQNHLLETMTSLHGIGDWTAHYILMRALNDPDLIPPGDLGLKKSLLAHDQTKSWTNKEMLSQAESWRPWRSYATMILWNSLTT